MHYINSCTHSVMNKAIKYIKDLYVFLNLFYMKPRIKYNINIMNINFIKDALNHCDVRMIKC